MRKIVEGFVKGNWKVIGKENKRGCNHYWKCICTVCGNESGVSESLLCSKRNPNNCIKCPIRNHELRSTYRSMLTRCYNPNSTSYSSYGARGIVVSGPWRESFSQFLQDMGDRPKGFTLERLDNNGPYSRENCIWASREQQGSNRRVNVKIPYKGILVTEAQLARLEGVSRTAVQVRRKKFGTDSWEELVRGLRKI